MASTSTKKIEKMYGALGPKEVRRMMAKLAREHNIDEMNRLRLGIAQEQARVYNDGLKLLRVVNGNLNDWVGLALVGMQRDRFRFQHLLRETALEAVLRYHLTEMWRFIKYPVTESELRTIRQLRRSELVSLDGYAEMLSEVEGSEEGLNPSIAEYINSLPEDIERERSEFNGRPSEEALQEDIRRGRIIEKEIRAIIDAAIKKGELPKPRKHEGELSLPWGVLTDWGEGT
ncbi:MAG: hypothetical protein KC435_10655, partial [Thermomicrobiales bacterium]|nr:hypothetical protein [Thermomicrobiales bacterium]